MYYRQLLCNYIIESMETRCLYLRQAHGQWACVVHLCAYSHRVYYKCHLNHIKKRLPSSFNPLLISSSVPIVPLSSLSSFSPSAIMPRSRSRRPVTSQSSHPSTAADDSAFSPPVTASSFTSDNPQPLPAALHPHAHYHHYYTDDRSTLDGVTEEEEDEDEDESDAEDVFAYLPPTTADIERERQQQQQQQQPIQPQPQYTQLQPVLPPQSATSPSSATAPFPSAESPPETSSSYDFVTNNSESLRLAPINYSRPSRESIPPYRPSPNIPTSALDVKRPISPSSPTPQSPILVPVPAPVSGPSQQPVTSTSSSYFPGSAFDNPYQIALFQFAEARMRYQTSHAPSTQGSGYTNSTSHHNINAAALSRNLRRRSRRTKNEYDRETVITTAEDASMSKFPSEVNTIDMVGRGLDHGSADWELPEGSLR